MGARYQTGMLSSQGVPNERSLKHLRYACLLGLLVLIFYDLIYLVQQRYDILIGAVLLTLALAIGLLQLRRPERIVMATAVVLLIFCAETLYAFVLEPQEVYWLYVAMFAPLLVLGHRALKFAYALMVVVVAIMAVDLFMENQLLSSYAWFNFTLSLLVLLLVVRRYMQFIESHQIALAEYEAQLQQELAQRERMEMARTMAGGIAHLINNEMQAIMMNAELLRLRDKDLENDKQLCCISDLSSRAGEHASQLLAFTGYGHEHEFETLDLAHLLQEYIAEYRDRLPGHVELPGAELESPLLCRCHRDQVRQLLFSLFDNCVEACQRQETIRVAAFRQAAEVCVSVIDNGSGMGEAVLERVFDPFYTTKFAGRGLGLAVASGIVSSHGGTIRMMSDPGTGSRVEFCFPLLEQA